MIISFEKIWYLIAILLVLSYLIGNVNFAIIISKIKKQDIRKVGSGNPGTLNMSRNFGLKIGVLTLALDIIKGVIPTLTGYLIFKDVYFYSYDIPAFVLMEIMCGFFAVLGHVFPVFMKFKGGKGVATTIGVFLVCNWYVGLISGILAIVFIMITEIGSMGSFVATTPGAFLTCYKAYFYFVNASSIGFYNILIASLTNLFTVAIIFLVWYAHKKNIAKLIAGEEHPTNWLQMLKESIIKKKVNKQK